MIRRAIGLLWSRIWGAIVKHRWLQVVLAASTFVIIVHFAMQFAFTHSIYLQNLRARFSLGDMPAPEKGQKILIFAPHEDDEVLGCGGYIQRALEAGADVNLVMMTNGEFPEVDVFLFEEKLTNRGRAFIDLGYRRQKETIAAMSFLGMPSDKITFLGYPNQYLNQLWSPSHWLPDSPVRSVRTRTTYSPYNNSMTPGAVYCGQSVLDDVEKLLIKTKPDVVITLHPSDVHPDHWPTYAFVEFALSELSGRGFTFTEKCRVYTYLIHRDAWPVPRGYRPDDDLNPPALTMKNNPTAWLSLPLTETEELRKQRALSIYKTQAGSIDPLLKSFIRPNELFGIVQAREWEYLGASIQKGDIEDPEGDTVYGKEYPEGDITDLMINRQDGRLMLTVITAKRASPGTQYHVSINAGGPSKKDRIIVEYDWQKGGAAGYIITDGVLKQISSKEIGINMWSTESTINVYDPFFKREPRFCMIRAWTTTHRNHIIDQTTTAVYKAKNITK